MWQPAKRRREPDLRACAPVAAVAKRCGPAPALGKRTHDRQPQPGAGNLVPGGAVEALEHALLLAGGNSGAIVADRQDRPIPGPGPLDRDGRTVTAVLDRILDQVVEDHGEVVVRD